MTKFDTAQAVLNQAIEEHKPIKMFALFSGGHDSLTATHVTAQHPAFSGVIHIDTGTGLNETQEFVVETCRREGWPLEILKGPFSYEQLIVRYGFPGPASHGYMYRYLKERPLMRFVGTQKTKTQDRIALSGGMRSQESQRRMGHVEPIHRVGAVVWVSPLHDWTGTEINRYVSANGLKRNKVKDNLHLSGECFCGSFASELELREVGFYYPYMEKRIMAWQRLVRAAKEVPGSEIKEQHCTWGWHDGMPQEQMELFPMCFYCHEQKAATQELVNV